MQEPPLPGHIWLFNSGSGVNLRPLEATEMTQQLRGLVALSKDLASIPSTHMVAQNSLTSVLGDPTLSAGL